MAEAETQPNPRAESEGELAPARVKELLESGEVQVVDVRTEAEWEAGRMPGSRHVVLDEVTAQAETIDRDRPVVFVCRGGSRSGMAAEAFRTAGYDAHNLGGGLRAWAEAGLPLEPEDGEVAEGGPIQ